LEEEKARHAAVERAYEQQYQTLYLQAEQYAAYHAGRARRTFLAPLVFLRHHLSITTQRCEEYQRSYMLLQAQAMSMAHTNNQELLRLRHQLQKARRRARSQQKKLKLLRKQSSSRNALSVTITGRAPFGQQFGLFSPQVPIIPKVAAFTETTTRPLASAETSNSMPSYATQTASQEVNELFAPMPDDIRFNADLAARGHVGIRHKRASECGSGGESEEE